MDGGVFYDDVPDSGTLRVKVITLETPADVGDATTSILEPLVHQLEKSEYTIHPVGDNALVHYEEPAVEDGTRLTIYYWVLANPVPPRNARVVTFSYTVLDFQKESPQTQGELEMLEAEIVRTEFASRIGPGSRSGG